MATRNGAALKVLQPTGMELDRLLKRLGELEPRQRELEEKWAPLVRAWLDAKATEARCFKAETTTHARWVTARGLRAEVAGKAHDLQRRHLQRARKALNEATDRLVAAAAELGGVRDEVLHLRERIGA